MYRSKLINVRDSLTITFPILHAHRETEANFYHPVEATGQVNISLCICEPGGEERYVHTVRSGTQSSRSHLIVSSCNTIMMAAAELIYLNTLYMFCALTCAGIETLVKTRPKQFKKISKNLPLWNSRSQYGPVFTLQRCFVYFGKWLFKHNRQT